MGCDIHPAIEYRTNTPEGVSAWIAVTVPNPYFGKYEDEPETRSALDIDRDYDLFAILGNVRNGRGFAGCDMGDGFIPMSDGRGVPEDISDEARSALSDEHSATWVTLSEILAYDWTRTTKSRGWINGEEFASWQGRKAEPRNYCGGISGTGIDHVSQVEMQRNFDEAVKDKRGLEYREAVEVFNTRYARTYSHVEWETGYPKAATQLWTRILPTMLKLGTLHGHDNVRLVMDFDS